MNVEKSLINFSIPVDRLGDVRINIFSKMATKSRPLDRQFLTVECEDTDSL